ncbi:hypothetical protein ACFQ5D_13025 [Paenibacillus farraposensis]|uniref:Uncharacterized protein n=1 Tax=Paenibacillus farraposensis TaxID=2807095 RepID=A0ABW4DF58_9BACL|nr:hypothetical protein [Paenibacillus farraposensis]MCC3379346.1 hypothetical protein [Paenibacillus farraposensis]
MAQQETWLIKHAVTGRSFADSRKQVFDCRLETTDGLFRFSLQELPRETAEAIVRYSGELNVFRFVTPEEQSIVKHWYYVTPESVKYNDQTGELTLEAGSEIKYHPEEYWGD